MKVAVGEGAIPADHDAVADADFGFAHEDDAGEIAVVADGDSAGFADGELAVVEGAVAANDHLRMNDNISEMIDPQPWSDSRFQR